MKSAVPVDTEVVRIHLLPEERRSTSRTQMDRFERGLGKAGWRAYEFDTGVCGRYHSKHVGGHER